jgi:hypothetical protein
MWTDSELSGVGGIRIPPWNYDFLLAGTILGIIPAVLIITGCVRALSRPVIDGRLFSLALVVIYYAVFLHLFMASPMHSVAKAAYTSSVIVCYVVLFGYGAEAVIRRSRAAAPVLYSFMVCWFVNIYCSYFIL